MKPLAPRNDDLPVYTPALPGRGQSRLMPWPLEAEPRGLSMDEAISHFQRQVERRRSWLRRVMRGE